MTSFLIIGVTVIITMLICRVVPLFVLKGRQLPEGFARALNLIPPAAFAALVANDLFSPGMGDAGLMAGLIPLIAAVIVLIVGKFTKSLVWCIIVGVGCYALLLFLL